MKKLLTSWLLCLLCSTPCLHAGEGPGRQASAKWQQSKWEARWIVPVASSKYDYGVHRFRKTIELENVPPTFVINLSADQRYEFFVNGQRVCRGPARGSLSYWYYETIDIVPYLKAGKNILAATVWNYGDWSPGAQISLYTGLIVQGEGEAEKAANTDGSWKTLHDTSFSPGLAYIQDVGPGDIIRGDEYPWGWNLEGYDDSGWDTPAEKHQGQPAGLGTEYPRALVPRTIPLMEGFTEPPLTIRRSSGVETGDNFVEGKPLVIPAGTKASILLDRGYLTNAYPLLSVSKGRGAKVSLTYAEGMFLEDNSKGNRNEIEGKRIYGFVDVFYPDGAADREYSTLWFRTYRYLQMDIETAGEELVVNSLGSEFFGYPFRENGYFESDDPSLSKIWEAGWRTARLCAVETYFDCPYYEQLQYIGDTRIQALISLYVSGDDRLMRKSIKDMGASVTPEGLLCSRYPARYTQIIPPYSLYWVNMLHDYWMYRTDHEFLRPHLHTMKGILEWFENRIDPQTGMLGFMPHWNFTDWPKDWPWDNALPLGGVPPGGRTGGSSILTLQLAYTLADAAELLEFFGDDALAAKYRSIQEGLCRATMEKCFDTGRNLMADDIAATSYSQQASIMGILSGAVPEELRATVFDNLTSDASLVQATVYYRFYLFMAMKKAGLADRYVSSLDIWHDMLAMGLTTFAEQPEPSRSDCHAWSASPNYDLLATVCGIMPGSPGFSTVVVEPHPGYLEHIKGRVPHPAGDIDVELRQEGGELSGAVILPEGLSGVYRHNGREIQLEPGENRIK